MISVTELFSTRYPIVQAGMVWCSGWRLASAVSNAGALGLIGSGSMRPGVLREHIRKCRAATVNPFGVNVPLMYPEIETLMSVIEEERVGIVFTSAGNPETWTGWLKERGIIVAHVISSMRFAKKAEAAGVHAVVAEGFEAGGHNGREETTTFCLVPMVRDAVQVPVIAAGGISSGRAMLAAMALGADGVQIGSRFAAAKESSAHPAFKQAVINADEGDTKLSLKKLAPVRLLRNTFAQKVEEAELNGADKAGLLTLLGHGRAKSGMFDGDLEHGELEIGQVSAMIREIQPAAAIVEEIWKEFLSKKEQLENNIR